jgi:hypothetical protein
MEIYGVRKGKKKKINKKPEAIKSRPEQERNAINNYLLSVQILSQKENKSIWLSSMWKKKVRGGDMLRKGHVGNRAKGM